jgi:hypothetical protein
MFVTISTSMDNEEFVRTALLNAGVSVIVEQKKKSEDPLKFSVPANVVSLSVLLHVVETNPEAFNGQVRLQDGRTFTLDEAGRTQLRDLLATAMRQPRPSEQPAPVWWMYFMPQIGKIIEEIAGLVHWYPRALGEGRRILTRNFVALILAIVVGVGILTFFGRVSGDAFVFVIGTLLGYIFAFLSKYLGLTSGE